MPNAVCVVILMVSQGPCQQHRELERLASQELDSLPGAVQSSLVRSVPLKEKAEVIGLTSVLDME